MIIKLKTKIAIGKEERSFIIITLRLSSRRLQTFAFPILGYIPLFPSWVLKNLSVGRKLTYQSVSRSLLYMFVCFITKTESGKLGLILSPVLASHNCECVTSPLFLSEITYKLFTVRVCSRTPRRLIHNRFEKNVSSIPFLCHANTLIKSTAVLTAKGLLEGWNFRCTGPTAPG